MLFADLVILDGNIITVDDKNPRAEALAAKDGKFVAVGATSQIKELVGKDTNVIDIQGKTVTPGFIDAHCHPVVGARRLLHVDCTPAKVKTIDDIVNALRERAKTTPKGKWIEGRRYDCMKLAEKRHPTRWDLDKASTEHPIYIVASGHIGVANSKALEIAKITKDSPDPPGGKFDRDENGELTGVCWDEAHFIFSLSSVSLVPPPTKEEDKKLFFLQCEKYLSVGITSVGDARVDPVILRLYQDALEDGWLPMRIYLMLWVDNLPYLKKLNLKTGFGNDRLKLGAIKIIFDGSIQAGTACLYEPYEGKPNDYGTQPAMTQVELDNKIFEAHEAGFQLAVHANGDRAIDMLLDSYEKALNKLPRVNHRHRIEHCTVVNPRILKRIKELGVVAIPHTYIYEKGDMIKELCGSRTSMMFAYRSFLDYRIPVAGHADEIEPIDPFLGIQGMVTRKSKSGDVLGSEQKISVEDAIRIYTLGSAYASFEENIKGSIEVRKLADFVVLSDDPTKVDPDTIKDIKVEKTVVGGEIIYVRR